MNFDNAQLIYLLLGAGALYMVCQIIKSVVKKIVWIVSSTIGTLVWSGASSAHDSGSVSAASGFLVWVKQIVLTLL